MPENITQSDDPEESKGNHTREGWDVTNNPERKEAVITRPKELLKFHNQLMSNAPEGYVPWYFPVQPQGKAPDPLAISRRAKAKSSCCNSPWVRIFESPQDKKGKIVCEKCCEGRASWKAPHAQLTFKEAYQRLKSGENVGIAARANDPLCLMDFDNSKHLEQRPKTLTVRTRKREGFHCYAFTKDTRLKCNIPTDHDGEYRSADQYVLAPGSYVPFTDQEIKKMVSECELTTGEAEKVRADPNRGYYTVEDELPPCELTFEQLPKIYKDELTKNEEAEKRVAEFKTVTINPEGKHSALYDLSVSDIINVLPNRRVPHPVHDSTTGQNFSISKDGKLVTCWRHMGTLNALQFLAMLSGYASCQDCRTPFRDKITGKKGVSKIRDDSGAIFYAWRQAKIMHLIPEDDPIPTRVMWWLAKKYKLIEEDYPEIIKLPTKIFNEVLEINLEEVR